MSEQITIPKLWSWQTAITVSIECDPSSPNAVKLGLAVTVAYATGADLRGADLRGADLTGADLTGAVLTGAVLTGAVLRGADLTGAVLTGAVLTGADLTGAVLRGADLTGADLTGAALRGADLTGAVLTGAVLRGEKVSRIFASIARDDGYSFLAFELKAGGVKISAGCRWFTVAEFRAHVTAKYPNTAKATETLWILDAIERRAADLGISLTPETDASPNRTKKVSK